jgi:hypothetical protein
MNLSLIAPLVLVVCGGIIVVGGIVRARSRRRRTFESELVFTERQISTIRQTIRRRRGAAMARNVIGNSSGDLERNEERLSELRNLYDSLGYYGDRRDKLRKKLRLGSPLEV